MIVPRFWEGEFHETEHFKFSKMGDEDILQGLDNWNNYIIDKNRGLVKKNTVRDYALDYALEHGIKLEHDALVTTTELTINEHVDTMSVFAPFVDSAISKTVNLPNDYPFEDFKALYLRAWKRGIKGITTYRAGTMTAVLTAKEEKERDDLNGEEIIHDSIKLPDSYAARGTILRAEGKKWYIHTNFFPESNRPFAIFVTSNSHEQSVVVNNAISVLENLARTKKIPEKWIEDSLNKSQGQAGAIRITRMISLCLRHGVLIRNIVSALNNVEGANVTTFVFAIRKYLASFIRDGEVAEGNCPDCNNKTLVFQEGCKKCSSCGWTACG